MSKMFESKKNICKIVKGNNESKFLSIDKKLTKMTDTDFGKHIEKVDSCLNQWQKKAKRFSLGKIDNKLTILQNQEKTYIQENKIAFLRKLGERKIFGKPDERSDFL